MKKSVGLMKSFKCNIMHLRSVCFSAAEGECSAVRYLVHVAQVILSITPCSVTCFPEGTS